ncbi:MAG TPA: IS1595 family transposase [Acidobacteriota bacterium]|nr:IS1595 family transposase [Acidobacteriota bacterium]
MPKTKNLNLVKLIEHFGSEDECRKYLEGVRWPNGVECPRCGCESVSEIKDRGQFDCNECRYQFSVKAGTIFHDSHLPLQKWFIAIYLMLESKKGVSANQLKRTIGVSYKTAWYLCHRIREAMKNGDEPKLRGTVEVDETFIGGKRKGVGSGNREGKTLVIGAAQRGGEIRLDIISDRGRRTLHKFIHGHAEKDSTVYTGEWQAYLGVVQDHETVNHHIEEWVNGPVHTNTAESVWSLLKRSIVGAYHKVSVKHLDRYLDELEFRFNNRRNPFIFRDALRLMVGTGNMEYRELISSG